MEHTAALLILFLTIGAFIFFVTVIYYETKCKELKDSLDLKNQTNLAPFKQKLKDLYASQTKTAEFVFRNAVIYDAFLHAVKQDQKNILTFMLKNTEVDPKKAASLIKNLKQNQFYNES